MITNKLAATTSALRIVHHHLGITLDAVWADKRHAMGHKVEGTTRRLEETVKETDEGRT